MRGSNKNPPNGKPDFGARPLSFRLIGGLEDGDMQQSEKEQPFVGVSRLPRDMETLALFPPPP